MNDYYYNHHLFAEPSPSRSPIKRNWGNYPSIPIEEFLINGRNWGNCLSIPIEGVSYKRARVLEDTESKALTILFWFPAILFSLRT